MTSKNKKYLFITTVVVLTLIWLDLKDRNNEPELTLPETNNSDQEILENAEDKITDDSVQVTEGALWISDDESRGNLMLITQDATLYINTSRDFSDLVGKNVLMSFTGTADKFTLINLEENRTRGGFINTN